jgi:hypothetical protein
MIALAKLIIGILLSLATQLEPTKKTVKEYTLLPLPKTMVTDSTILRAYKVLGQKCNICHSKRNKRHVFTPNNMNPMAADVNKQVFLKNKCPRARKSNLHQRNIKFN